MKKAFDFLIYFLLDIIKVFRFERLSFLSPYVHIDKKLDRKLKFLIENPDESYVNIFEKEFANSLGDGECISFASGRMAFFSILKALNIGEGDEVALTGFTCSVMSNAVLRTGATPIYVDIDINTLGMSPGDLQKKLSLRTKAVVAQHTFGIPCEIDKILDIVKSRNIYLIEDCAISFQSSFKNIKIGTFGVASIFSTDHTKPLNSLIGGCAYTNDATLKTKLRQLQRESSCLSPRKQYRILQRYKQEQQIENISHNLFPLLSYYDKIKNIVNRIKIYPYLTYDSFSVNRDDKADYRYPSKMPPMIACLVLISLRNYTNSIQIRKKNMMDILEQIRYYSIVPNQIFNPEVDIVPLRIPVIGGENYRNIVDDWIWFKAPIIATPENIEEFNYKNGDCPLSEKIGKSIGNLPIYVEEKKHKKLLSLIRKSVS